MTIGELIEFLNCKQDWLRREWPDKSRSGNGETRFNEAWSRTPR